jgi:hypothetical protein
MAPTPLHPEPITCGSLEPEVNKLRLAWWIAQDRLRYGLSKRRERMWMAIARRLPRSLQRWVIVNAACKVWVGDNIVPEFITYEKMCKTLDKPASA